MSMSEQENLAAEQSEADQILPFEKRYFVSVNADHYIVGMMIAFSQADAENYSAMELAELTQAQFESVGQDCQLIGGEVVKGPPMVSELSTQAKQAILAARLREATQKVQMLQDAVDLDMATDEEKAQLTAWKKYRVLLSRADAEAQSPEEWPQPPM